MELFSGVFLVCFFAWLFFANKDKRKLAFTVHVQERTEEAENLDFGVQFFADETEDKWREKLEVAFRMAEERRSFNNKRMMEMFAKAEENKVTPFKKA